jgi:transposase-like protein
VNLSHFGKAAASRPRSTGAVTIPTVCPACQSRSITTTARTPDESTYWRCDSCGEIWNVSRRDAGATGVHEWR